jgi:hypothetical protein
MLTIQIKPTNGRLDNLRFVIKELASRIGHDLSKEELLKNVQASEYELDRTLRKIGVIETSRGLRVLEQVEIIRATQMLFNGIMRNGVSLQNLDQNLCISWCEFEEGKVMKYVLSTLGSAEADVWHLDELRVGQASVRVIFNNIKVFF